MNKIIMNINIIISTFLRYVRELGIKLPLYMFMCILGVICVMGRDLWINETENTLMGSSLLLSLITLVISNYFIVENAIEARLNNKKKLFSDYCARFSGNQNISKVVEWLLNIAEFDSNGVLINVNPKRLNDNKGRTISEPTIFQKKCFGDFLIELNIQIKNKQLEIEDVRRYFSPYALIFNKALQVENNKVYYMWNSDDFSAIL